MLANAINHPMVDNLRGNRPVSPITSVSPPSIPSSPPVQQAMPTGPFYSEDLESRVYNGQWSDGLFECCSDPSSGIMTVIPCLWPVLLAKITYNMQGLIPASPLPSHLGVPFDRYLVAAYAIVVLICFVLPFVSIIAYLIMIVIVLHTFAIVKQRYNLPEEPACMQLSDVCLTATFLHPCFISRIWRHVGRARGWVPPSHSVGVRDTETIVV